VARTFYRIVRNDPPSLDDFKSYLELGIPLRREDPEARRMAAGISVYSQRRQAARRARLRPSLGRFIAELVIPDGSVVTFQRTGLEHGHHTLWGPAELLLSYTVAPVLPVE
jgi:hypothetical protein